jgi:predicted enzyme related to lactoylglutathione lyase
VHDEYKEPIMTEGIKAIIYPVGDLAKAKTLYGKLLGVEPDMDEPYYVNFNVEGKDVGLDPDGHGQGMTSPVVYWHVDDIEKSLQDLLGAGAKTQQAVRDVGRGKLIASVEDADGNAIGLHQSP